MRCDDRTLPANATEVAVHGAASPAAISDRPRARRPPAPSGGASPRPPAMAALRLGLVLLVVLSAGTARSAAAGNRATAFAGTIEDDVLTLINGERAGAGLPVLERIADADQAASLRAADMAAGGYLGHVSRTGIGAARLLEDLGVPYRLVGENIARSNYPLDQLVPVVHAAWMASPGHRQNVLDGRYHRVGIGAARLTSMYYIAVIFLD
jgi:uncharacterized protein YkwD